MPPKRPRTSVDSVDSSSSKHPLKPVLKARLKSTAAQILSEIKDHEQRLAVQEVLTKVAKDLLKSFDSFDLPADAALLEADSFDDLFSILKTQVQAANVLLEEDDATLDRFARGRKEIERLEREDEKKVDWTVKAAMDDIHDTDESTPSWVVEEVRTRHEALQDGTIDVDEDVVIGDAFGKDLVDPYRRLQPAMLKLGDLDRLVADGLGAVAT